MYTIDATLNLISMFGLIVVLGLLVDDAIVIAENVFAKKPWLDYGPAVNYISKKSYRGINQLILNGLHVKPFYLTFKQAQLLGGHIKKGARSIPVTYWNFTYRDKETSRKINSEEAKKLPASQVVKTAFLKYYRVFNIDDVDPTKSIQKYIYNDLIKTYYQ